MELFPAQSDPKIGTGSTHFNSDRLGPKKIKICAQSGAPAPFINNLGRYVHENTAITHCILVLVHSHENSIGLPIICLFIYSSGGGFFFFFFFLFFLCRPLCEKCPSLAEVFFLFFFSPKVLSRKLRSQIINC
jgi:hypothetical protein